MDRFILKEGIKPFAILLIFAVVLDIFGFDTVANIGYIGAILLLIIFRDTKRDSYSLANEIVAPINGKIIAIDLVDDKKLIYLKVSLCGNHSLKAPIEANMKITHFQKGLNLPPYLYKAKKLNEQITIEFNDVKLQLLSGLCNIPLDIKKQEYCTKGCNIGVFLDGIVIIQIPSNATIYPQIGNKIKSNSPIAVLHNQ